MRRASFYCWAYNANTGEYDTTAFDPLGSVIGYLRAAQSDDGTDRMAIADAIDICVRLYNTDYRHFQASLADTQAYNRYGEIVSSFHSPVCVRCQQRIGAGVPYEPGNAAQGNICQHCHNYLTRK